MGRKQSAARPFSVVVWGPAGSGKTRHAAQLQAHFGLARTVDNADQMLRNAYALNPYDTLHLTQERPHWAPQASTLVVHIDDALRACGATP